MDDSEKNKKKIAKALAKKEYLRKYNEENKEMLKIKKEKYRQLHREKLLLKMREYYAKNAKDFKAKAKEYRLKKVEYYKEQGRNYYKNNTDSLKEYQKTYRNKNKEGIQIKKKAYIRNKSKTNPIFRMLQNIRSRLGGYFRNNSLNKKRKTLDYVGCTPEFLMDYLALQFKEGMTRENHGAKGWHIDHIIPLSSAGDDREMAERLCHYTNLQPLWWYENLSKGARVL